MSEQNGQPAEPVHVDNRDQFEETVGDGGVVLVDYYADWCGPCKMMEPAIEAVAADTDAIVLKLDVDEHQDLAREAGVRSIPTLQFYANGEAARRLVGVQDEDALRDVVAELAN
jgi:thioredoxin 1